MLSFELSSFFIFLIFVFHEIINKIISKLLISIWLPFFDFAFGSHCRLTLFLYLSVIEGWLTYYSLDFLSAIDVTKILGNWEVFGMIVFVSDYFDLLDELHGWISLAYISNDSPFELHFNKYEILTFHETAIKKHVIFPFLLHFSN